MIDPQVIFNSAIGYLIAAGHIYIVKRSVADEAFRRVSLAYAAALALGLIALALALYFPRNLLRFEYAKLAAYILALAWLFLGAPFWLQKFPSFKFELPAWDMGMEARNELRKYKMILLLGLPVLFVGFLIWWSLPEVLIASGYCNIPQRCPLSSANSSVLK